MNCDNNLSKTILLVAGSLMASCSAPQKITTKNKTNELPEVFTKDTSSSIARYTQNEFFKDSLLKATIKDVLQQNPDMNIALQRIKVASASFKMSKGAMLPSLQINNNASGTKYGKHTMEGVGNYDTNLSDNIEENQKINTDFTPYFFSGFSSSWEIDLWGKLRNLKKAARSRFMASQEAASWIKSTLVAQTASLYYYLVALDKEAEIISENIRLQERALEIVEAQKAGGRATELAVQQFKAQLLNTKSAEFDIKQRILETENELNILAGRYNGKIKRSKDLQIDRHFNDIIGTGIPAAMLNNRPDIRQAYQELEAAKADALAARAAFFPSLNISTYAAFNSFKGNLLFTGTSLGYQILGGLTAPVFQKHQIKSQFRIANANQEQAFWTYEKTALNAYREVLNNLNAMQNTKSMFLLKEQEVAALATGVNISSDLYVTGYASYLEIVAAQKSKLEAELQLVTLQQKQLSSYIGLYQALGGGWQ